MTKTGAELSLLQLPQFQQDHKRSDAHLFRLDGRERACCGGWMKEETSLKIRRECLECETGCCVFALSIDVQRFNLFCRTSYECYLIVCSTQNWWHHEILRIYNDVARPLSLLFSCLLSYALFITSFTSAPSPTPSLSHTHTNWPLSTVHLKAPESVSKP